MRKVDVIVVGSGFAGSIMAMILRRLGKRVAILEKARHPRFAIGESSTPLANLLLEELAAKYDLPDLGAFSKWGTWQAAHPEIACGLKRGFTFYKHEFGRAVDFSDRSQQLLVAASPHDRIADTHWYRPDFDAYLAQKAREMGVDLVEGANGPWRATNEGGWKISAEAGGAKFEFVADYLIDGSGPRGFLFRHFGFQEGRDGFAANSPQTSAVFAHFENVKRIDRSEPGLPYPVDDAAVHHIFDGGWIWVLRFNNGITSAGAIVTQKIAEEIRPSEGQAAWERLLKRLPTVRGQFENARTVTEFFVQPKVAFRSPRAAGTNWAMLPSAAGFVDPLFSTGFALTLLGVERLARIFESGITEKALAGYEEATFRELDQAGYLVRAAYEKFETLSAFADISRVYFAAAIWAETLRRLGRKAPDFLLADDAAFSEMIRNLGSGDEQTRREFIERIDLSGLMDDSRRNWHPVRAEDLFANASKIPASRDEIEAMLRRCGF
jgi:FADH2 O2-dependent halogenase